MAMHFKHETYVCLFCATPILCAGAVGIGLDVLENNEEADKPERKRPRMDSSQDTTLKVRIALKISLLINIIIMFFLGLPQMKA